MSEFLEKVFSFDIILMLVAINIFLSGLSSAIEKLEDIIPGDQSKIIAGIKWVLNISRKIIDIAGMNKQHK